MARDPALEELVSGTLGDLSGLSGKAMFGGWAFLLNGKLLCGAGRGSLMVRVGPEEEIRTLEIAGVAPVVMRGRRTPGYVRAAPEVYVNDELRERLLGAAVAFVRSLLAEKSRAGKIRG